MLHELLKFSFCQSLFVPPYLIQNHITAKVIKSEKIKYDIRCRGSTGFKCRFKVRVSYDKKKGYYVLREFIDEHNCQYTIHVQTSAAANPEWLAKKYQAVIIDQPTIKPGILAKTIKRELGEDVSYATVHRAKEFAIKSININEDVGFKMIDSYCTIIQDRGGVAEMCVDKNDKFLSVFVTLKECIEAFDFLMPVVSLDGTFLRGKYLGNMLLAVGKDGNGNTLPLSWAIIIGNEDIANWTWFMEKMLEAYPQINRENIVFVSNRDKGLIEGVYI